MNKKYIIILMENSSLLPVIQSDLAFEEREYLISLLRKNIGEASKGILR